MKAPLLVRFPQKCVNPRNVKAEITPVCWYNVQIQENIAERCLYPKRRLGRLFLFVFLWIVLTTTSARTRHSGGTTISFICAVGVIVSALSLVPGAACEIVEVSHSEDRVGIHCVVSQQLSGAMIVAARYVKLNEIRV
jgi:hypothetical protein